MPIHLLIIFLLSLSGGLLAQQKSPAATDLPSHLRPRPFTPIDNLSGLWVGELRQNAGGFAEKFELSMQLSHNGIFLSGRAYVKIDDIFAELRLSGHELPNGSWKLTETEFIRSKAPEQLEFCYKTYELRASFADGGIVLSGPWWGRTETGPCVPGSVRLVLKKKRA